MDVGKILRIKLVILSLILALTLLTSRWLLGHASVNLERKNFGQFPYRIGEWAGSDMGIPIPILEKLGVDDHLMRFYENGTSSFSLYIGYYSSQKGTKTIHSPKHCYPGSGWYKLESSIIPVHMTERNGGAKTIFVNRYLLEKGGERELVYYWYQSAGSVDASEVNAIIRRFYNSMFRNRTDGSLVRISTRIKGRHAAGLAEDREVIPLVYSFLGEYIPE